ncbi:acyloxyacyl hydrolase [Marinospirillum perlucidum]|uniref:acyloxyacyl hydrolase n=1 Tax=Marinospirillum perlucidum TaxID=1982602 RepID=UPI000DF1D8EF|nr:acyloxyacyl hydrolase [Marinospirillum perlucidum]
MSALQSCSRAGLFLFLALVLAPSLKAQPVEGSAFWQTAVATTLITTLATNPMGADAVLVESGQGEEVMAHRAAWRWHWQDLHQGDWLQIKLYGQVALEYWEGKREAGTQDRNNLLVLTPVFRLQTPLAWLPYLETSIGATFMSASRFPATDHEFGQNYQFSDTLALGWQWGAQQQWELALRYRHYSNNGMAEQNNGIDFNILALSYHY